MQVQRKYDQAKISPKPSFVCHEEIRKFNYILNKQKEVTIKLTFQILMLNASVGQPKKIIRSQSHAAVRGPHAGRGSTLPPKC
jgi:hypothetical protein